ncbi:MAG: NAD(P)/FAD-dependent oxidoreductase [Desulfobacteraceae bacterium]|nr:NAD(P)/FAD-dependent oxidoreductase [Desulfobacteraceae bacterium]
MRERYEVVILGTGPAGLQAAIHAARAKVSTLVLGRRHKSSLYRAHVENYCCLEKISGEELLEQGYRQAAESGADFLDEDVLGIDPEEEGFAIRTESGNPLFTRAVILAMGIHRNRLGVSGEKEFLGKGVSYCVDCDAGFFKGGRVAVVGSESAAVSGVLTLLFYAAEVHLVAEELRVTDRLAYQLENAEAILHLGRKAVKIIGDTAVTGLELDDGTVLSVEGVFVETGAKGAVELAANLGVALDSETFRYIDTDKEQKTSVPGIYAAGDICGPPWQVAKAVGEGCVAGLSAAKYVKKLR